MNTENTPLAASFNEQQAKMCDALFARAVKFHQAGNIDGAEAIYHNLLTFNPNHAETLHLLGTINIQRGDYVSGIHFIDRAIALFPQHALAYNNRAFALQNLKRFDEALLSIDHALALNPDFADALLNRGIILEQLRRYDEAVTSYDKVLAVDAHSVEAHNNRGNALTSLNRYEEALQSFGNAIAINPSYTDAYNNIGFVYYCMAQFAAALEYYDKAIALSPEHADAWWNKAVLKLLLGEFEEGWKLYEWRWKKADNLACAFDKPLWLGDTALDGKTILLYFEQGFGDTIQFARYVTQLKTLGADIILQVQTPLLELFSTFDADIQVIAQAAALPAFDYHCPLLSLPLACGKTLPTLPVSQPYLQADAVKRMQWQQKSGKKLRPRIGLVTSGTMHHKNDHNRSIPFNMLEPLWQSSLEFHLLQKEIRDGEREMLDATPVISHIGQLEDFAETAALIAEMDLVITVDTSIAHLTGAMGKPVWILLPFIPDFRWMLDRTDSPWYPTAKLFRQPAIGDWASVIANVRAQLKNAF